MIRVLNKSEVDQLLDEGVKGGNVMTVRSVIATRDVVELSVVDDGMAATVTAKTRRGGRLEMMGITPYDATQRLATLILRP